MRSKSQKEEFFSWFLVCFDLTRGFEMYSLSWTPDTAPAIAFCPQRTIAIPLFIKESDL